MVTGETNNRTVGPVTTAAATGTAVAGILAWLVKVVFNIDMPSEVVAGLAIIIPVAGAIIGGWLVRPGTGRRIATKGDHVAG